MSTKLIGLLVAAVIAVLGIIAVMMMNKKPEQPASQITPVAADTPVAVKPRLDPHRGYFEKSKPGKYQYETPK